MDPGQLLQPGTDRHLRHREPGQRAEHQRVLHRPDLPVPVLGGTERSRPPALRQYLRRGGRGLQQRPLRVRRAHGARPHRGVGAVVQRLGRDRQPRRADPHRARLQPLRAVRRLRLAFHAHHPARRLRLELGRLRRPRQPRRPAGALRRGGRGHADLDLRRRHRAPVVRHRQRPRRGRSERRRTAAAAVRRRHRRLGHDRIRRLRGGHADPRLHAPGRALHPARFRLLRARGLRVQRATQPEEPRRAGHARLPADAAGLDRRVRQPRLGRLRRSRHRQPRGRVRPAFPVQRAAQPRPELRGVAGRAHQQRADQRVRRDALLRRGALAPALHGAQPRPSSAPSARRPASGSSASNSPRREGSRRQALRASASASPQRRWKIRPRALRR